MTSENASPSSPSSASFPSRKTKQHDVKSPPYVSECNGNGHTKDRHSHSGNADRSNHSVPRMNDSTYNNTTAATLSTPPSKVIKGEIHNILSLIRTDPTLASPLRFHHESTSPPFLDSESSSLQAYQQHPLISSLHDLDRKISLSLYENNGSGIKTSCESSLDVMSYISPFATAVIRREISGTITGAALGSLHKFLLYGYILPHMVCAQEGITRIARCIKHCTFCEEMGPKSLNNRRTIRSPGISMHQDEEVVMKILSLSALVIRCEAGVEFLSPSDTVGIFETCLHVACKAKNASRLLRSAAGDTLAHIVVIVFGREGRLSQGGRTEEKYSDEREEGASRCSDDLWVEKELVHDHSPDQVNAHGDGGGLLPRGDVNKGASQFIDLENSPEANTDPDQHLDDPNIQPAFVTIMQRLTTLLNPILNPDSTASLSLSLINTALDTAPSHLLTTHPIVISTLQNDLCKHLLQLSTTSDPVILSLTLRVIFNLFNSIRNHLKVQLEVFLTSVHLRILENKNSSPEQKELALESLLEFCHEPALMHDLYTNYDCDMQCTNLFERICGVLAKGVGVEDSSPTEETNLNVLNRLSLEGILAVIDSIVRRCTLPKQQKNSDIDSTDSYSSSDECDESPSSSNFSDDLSWMEKARHRTSEILSQRKRKKQLLSSAATTFNTEDDKSWIPHVESLGIFPSQYATPSSVADFLFFTPNLNKTKIGLYLSKGPKDKYPFISQVLTEFTNLFEFKGMTFSEALRTYLSRFRLPGEAQCIDRLMEAFASRLFHQFSSLEECLFHNQDAVFILAFSTIMLNTDLHSSQIPDERRMTISQFLNNNRGINNGEDLQPEFVSELYYQILYEEISVNEDNDEDSSPLYNHPEEENTYNLSGKKWAEKLKKEELIATPFFTTQISSIIYPAGPHERDMFISIFSPALKCSSYMFVRSWDDALVVKALRGLLQMAEICIYFELDEEFNEILCLLFGYGKDYIWSVDPIRKRRDGTALEDEQEDEEDYPIPFDLLDGNKNNLLSFDSDGFTGSAAHRGLLALHRSFWLANKYPSRIREGWPYLMECLFALRDVRVLPVGLADLDDFADCNGTILPPSTFSEQAIKRVIHWSRPDEDEKGHAGPGGFWVFLKTTEKNNDKDIYDYKSLPDEQHQLQVCSALASISQLAQLDEIIMRSRDDLPLATQVLRALLDARDPIEVESDDYKLCDDGPLFEHHAVFALELATRALLSNCAKAADLYPIVLTKLEGILLGGKNGDHDNDSITNRFPYLMERAIVTILRTCIHLFGIPEMRPQLLSSLCLISKLPPLFIHHIADRLACGLAIILRGSYHHLQTKAEWTLITNLLDSAAQYQIGRGFVFDGIASCVECSLSPVSPQEEHHFMPMEGAYFIVKLLIKFTSGGYENDVSVCVPSMICLENLFSFFCHNPPYSHETKTPRAQGYVPRGIIYRVPDEDLWCQVVFAYYSVCLSPDPHTSQQGFDCTQNILLTTDLSAISNNGWITVLILLSSQQPDIQMDISRVKSADLLARMLLLLFPYLCKDHQLREKLEHIVYCTASIMAENLRVGRKGNVNVLFESTVQLVTNLSNVLLLPGFGENEQDRLSSGNFCQWAGRTLFSELEKIGAGGGSTRLLNATTSSRLIDEENVIVEGNSHSKDYSLD